MTTKTPQTQFTLQCSPARVQRALAILATALLLVGVAGRAGAVDQTDLDRTVGRIHIGAQAGGSRLSVSVVEGFTLNCQFGVVTADLTTVFGRSIFAAVLTARAAALPLWRIRYRQDDGPGSECFAVLITVDQ